MSTLVSVNTYTHSVTYVTDQMLRSLKFIISNTGLDTAKFVGDWSSYELALKTWLDSKHLRTLVLEVVSSSGSFVTRCDFDIDYGYGNGEGSMWVDTDALRYAIIKFGTFPSSCSYNIKLTTAAGRPDVVGWGPCTFLSTDGYIKQGLGTTIGTHSIGASASYWRQK
ncbi:MAG: HORMA domain containing protein [Proteobacteria bacterium]|nr:MAG: HORMA domain containing protein [Pseudomonadota bacterium]